MEILDLETKAEDVGKNSVATLKADVSDSLLHHRVNNRLMLLIVFVLVLLAGMYVHSVRKDGENAARIQDMMKTNADTQKATVQELKESFAKQVELAKQQKTIETRVIERDKAADKATTTVTAPDRTVEQTTQDVHDYLGMLPKFIPDEKLFGFTQPDTQKIVTFKIDADRYKQNYTDSQKDLGIATQRIDGLTTDKTVMQQTIDGDKKTIDALDKIKQPSAFKQNLKLVGAGVLGAALYALTHPQKK
jgi:hypothetical protein